MIEALYFSCYYAYLHKNLKDSEMFYGMLRDELKKTKTSNPLRPEYLKELKKVRDSIKTGSFISSEWVSENVPVKLPKISGEPFRGNQDDLVRKIHYEAFEDLKSILEGGEDFRLYNIEHPCGTYGAVDMVYSDKEKSFPIEVKKDEGRHDIISQIAKYDLSFKLKLHLKRYYSVKPVTICGSYQNNVIKELRSLGVTVILYWIDDGKVKLSKIY
jgi:hypothetical protein